jgi:hypothetical protein
MTYERPKDARKGKSRHQRWSWAWPASTAHARGNLLGKHYIGSGAAESRSAAIRGIVQGEAQQRGMDFQVTVVSMKPGIRNLFMKKLMRDRSGSVSHQ